MTVDESRAADRRRRLILQVPIDGTPRSLRTLLDTLEPLDQHARGMQRLTVHTPDLDDVFAFECI